MGAQSRMQIHNQWNENTKDGGGGRSHVTCTYHPLPKCSGLHSSCRQMLNRTSADSSGLKQISEHPTTQKILNSSKGDAIGAGEISEFQLLGSNAQTAEEQQRYRCEVETPGLSITHKLLFLEFLRRIKNLLHLFL